MAKQPPQINFEVYYLQDGRWTLQSRYDLTEKHLAVKEGKELSKLDHLSAVKVIKEKYNREDGTSTESIIFRHSKGQIELADPNKGRGVVIPEKKKSNKARGVILPNGGKSDPMVGGSSGGKGGQPKTDQEIWEEQKRGSGMGLAPKVILIVLLSVVIAALFTGLGSMVMTKFPMFSGLMKQETAGSVLFSLFVVGFLISCATLFYSFVSKEDIQKPPPEAPRRTAVAEDLPESGSTPTGVVSDKEKELAEKRDEEEGPASPPSDQVAASTAATEEQSLTEMAAELSSSLSGGSGATATTTVGVGVAGAKNNAGKNKQDTFGFFSLGIARLQEEKIPLDKYNKFGMSLFMAGAIETFKERNNLSHLNFSTLLRDTVTLLGTSKKMAETFAEKYDTYLVEDSRYMEVYRAGRQAMTSHIENGKPPGESLLAAINQWNKPKDEQGGKEPITVVFTDMVGSTDITQALGDEAAQQVVRAHNTIVRNSLKLHQGKEIKHTGDGIMASFSSGSEAIRATIEMQKDILRQNEVEPDLPLKVRIGLNTGELIMEENDLFGTTVQLAARICDKADAGEIYVSGATKAICSGVSDLFFKEHGGVELKGFKEPIPLFKVVWHGEELAEMKAERDAEQAAEAPLEEGKAEPSGDAPEESEEETKDAAPEEGAAEGETSDLEDDGSEELFDEDDGSDELFDEEPELDLPPMKQTPPSGQSD